MRLKSCIAIYSTTSGSPPSHSSASPVQPWAISNNRWSGYGIGDVVGMQLAQSQLFKASLAAQHQRQGKEQSEMDQGCQWPQPPRGNTATPPDTSDVGNGCTPQCESADCAALAPVGATGLLQARARTEPPESDPNANSSRPNQTTGVASSRVPKTLEPAKRAKMGCNQCQLSHQPPFATAIVQPTCPTQTPTGKHRNTSTPEAEITHQPHDQGHLGLI